MDHVRSAPARTPRMRRLTTRLAGVTTVAVVAAGRSAATAEASYDPEVWDRVAQCESSGNWSINTGNGFYGGLQFYHPSWKAFGGQQYGTYAHQASKEAQIAIGRRVLHAQGPGAWPVCSVKAGLTRANGGADPNAKPGDGKEEPAPGQPVTRYVSASNAANVRSGPGVDYSVVGAKARGAEVKGTMTSSGWLKLAEGQFISSTVLSQNPVGGQPAPDPGPVTRYVSASNAANVRSGAGLGYSVVGAKARGTQVSGTMTSNGWLKLAEGQYISSTVLASSPVDGTVVRYVSASNAASVRSGPGLNYRIVDGKVRGTKVVGTLSNGWLKIAEGQYISATVLSKWAV